MAAVEVTISGVLYDKTARTTQPVVLIGEASLTGVGIGGGPIIPPDQPKPPLGIWGPTDPRPTPPIAFPPGWVGGVPPVGQPPGIWGGANEPFPTPPIVIPPPSWQPPADFTPPPPGQTAPVGPPLQPVNPIVVPDFILVQYPGNGWIAVGKPVAPPA